jgi:hypothetical protein
MPHIKPASREAKAAYRQGLPPELRGTFDRLAEALADWRYELGWYHQVGTLLRQLRQGGTPEGGGSWLKGLPGALNVSPGLLVKASRFAELYPRKKDVRELEDLGVDWTRVTLAFPVKDRAERHELLDEAVKKGWGSQQLRFEVQRQHPSGRRGVGGRPRKEPLAYGAELTLRQLGKLAGRLLDFQRSAWSGVDASDWRELGKEVTGQERARLRQVLIDTLKTLSDVETNCRQARGRLAKLLERLS